MKMKIYKKIIIILIIIIIIAYNQHIENNTIKEAKEKLLPSVNSLYLTKGPKTMTETFNSSINWRGRELWLVVYWDQLEEMKKRGYTNTRILDLLAIKSQECNAYIWCEWIWGLDIWPFQINYVHFAQYWHSWEMWEDGRYWELYQYQLWFADQLVESYHQRFCSEVIFKLIKKPFTNEARLKCVAVSYNWWPDKVNYSKKVWEKRKVISEFLFREGYLKL